MAFNPLEYLEVGKVDFVYKLNSSTLGFLIECIRKSDNKINIIKGFLSELKETMPYFCFEIIYDTDEYVDDLFGLMNGKFGCAVGYTRLINDATKIKNILYNTIWGRNFVYSKLDNIVSANEENIKIILSYVFSSFDDNRDFVSKLSIYKDLHVRYLFMKYLIEQCYEKIDFVYDDIIKYLTNYNYQDDEQLTFLPELMSKEDVSDLAVSVLRYNKDIHLWNRFKEYILANYKTNDLAKLLLTTIGRDFLTVDEFVKDADRLFVTSHDYKYSIFDSFFGYKRYLSKEVIDDFEEYLKYFKKPNILITPYNALANIFEYGLWEELVGYVDKYLKLSKDKSYCYLSSGSTSVCYRIGDYVFKLVTEKYSQEDVICPNLYLIIKNLEEHYVRDDNGDVVCGIEVQKYLKGNNMPIDLVDICNWEKSLDELGYYFEDSLLNSIGGDNCAILDSYRDADCSNPEKLPEWFKETPLVLIDRDLVYKLERKKKMY